MWWLMLLAAVRRRHPRLLQLRALRGTPAPRLGTAGWLAGWLAAPRPPLLLSQLWQQQARVALCALACCLFRCCAQTIPSCAQCVLRCAQMTWRRERALPWLLASLLAGRSGRGSSSSLKGEGSLAFTFLPVQGCASACWLNTTT